jgi:hypothetical protein
MTNDRFAPPEAAVHIKYGCPRQISVSVTRLIFYQIVSWIITIETIQAESGSQRQR